MKVVHSWLGEYLGKSLPEKKDLEDLMNFHIFELNFSIILY
jgi:hypothetical protein